MGMAHDIFIISFGLRQLQIDSTKNAHFIVPFVLPVLDSVHVKPGGWERKRQTNLAEHVPAVTCHACAIVSLLIHTIQLPPSNLRPGFSLPPVLRSSSYYVIVSDDLVPRWYWTIYFALILNNAVPVPQPRTRREGGGENWQL